MTQTSEITSQTTKDLWTRFEDLSAVWAEAQQKEDACWFAYRQASVQQREAWDASQAAYAAYRAAVDGGSK